MTKSVDVLSASGLTGLPDFAIGSILVSPARRLVQGPAGTLSLQPQVMLVLLCLAKHRGTVVTRRDLFDRCWGDLPVGDDSLNRAITRIRRMLASVSDGDVSLETVPGTGYRLAAARQEDLSERLGLAVEAAFDCWRLGFPRPDTDEIETLTHALALECGEAKDWGMLALLLRKAAEYGDAADCSDYARRCEQAARKALALDANEPNALVARAGLTPLFGNWTAVRDELSRVIDHSPDNAPARHELLFLEMATGRPSVAWPMLEQLLREDRFAATYYYKAMYQLWTMDRLHDAEQLAARGMALWPRHPAIWMSRFWTLTCTGRANAALRLVADQSCRPELPSPMLELLTETAALKASRDSGEAVHGLGAHIAKAVHIAASGPANAIAALQALCTLDAIDEAFEVAQGYYLGQGGASVPLRWSASDPSITDLYRRVTQPLFIPSACCMRGDPRFLALCDKIGLSAYWRAYDIVPDFLVGNQ